jgi:hypothetical protein
MIDLIRDLSIISRQMRYELGVVFWTRTYLDCENLNWLDLLPAFFADRPLVISGIKVLSLKNHARHIERERKLKLDLTHPSKNCNSHPLEILTFLRAMVSSLQGLTS